MRPDQSLKNIYVHACRAAKYNKPITGVERWTRIKSDFHRQKNKQ